MHGGGTCKGVGGGAGKGEDVSVCGAERCVVGQYLKLIVRN